MKGAGREEKGDDLELWAKARGASLRSWGDEGVERARATSAVARSQTLKRGGDNRPGEREINRSARPPCATWEGRFERAALERSSGEQALFRCSDRCSRLLCRRSSIRDVEPGLGDCCTASASSPLPAARNEPIRSPSSRKADGMPSSPSGPRICVQYLRAITGACRLAVPPRFFPPCRRFARSRHLRRLESCFQAAAHLLSAQLAAGCGRTSGRDAGRRSRPLSLALPVPAQFPQRRVDAAAQPALCSSALTQRTLSSLSNMVRIALAVVALAASGRARTPSTFPSRAALTLASSNSVRHLSRRPPPRQASEPVRLCNAGCRRSARRRAERARRQRNGRVHELDQLAAGARIPLDSVFLRQRSS